MYFWLFSCKNITISDKTTKLTRIERPFDCCKFPIPSNINFRLSAKRSDFLNCFPLIKIFDFGSSFW